MKKIFFVRHGESEANLKKIIAGRMNVGLTELGKKQAKNAGIELNKSGQQIDLIVSSPLKRALDTAQTIANEINYPRDKIIINNDAIERYRGKLEGITIALKNSMTDHKYIDQETESENNVLLRAKELFDFLKSRKEENILVVSHNQIGRSLVSLLTKTERADVERLPNAHIFEIKIKS